MTQTKPYKIELHSDKKFRVWWTPKPECKGNAICQADDETGYCLECDSEYYKWQSSYVTLECAEGEYESIREQVYYEINKKEFYEKYELEAASKVGFDVTSFAEVREIDMMNSPFSEQRVFFCAPESVEEVAPYVSIPESEMWVEVIDIIQKKIEGKITSFQSAKQLVDKFTIKRK